MKFYILRTLILASLLCLLGSCLSSDSGMKLSSEEMAEPVVEAFIEYPGPQEKWAGPENFMLHINSADAGRAKILLTRGREPGQKATPRLGLSQQETREALKRLEIAVQESLPEFHGCLSPVRLRLIQSNGTVVQRQACRGQTGWPKMISELTYDFIEKAYFNHNKRAPAKAEKENDDD